MTNRERIIEYIKKQDKVGPAKVSRDLRIEFSEVMRITTQLVKEGILETIEKND